MIGQPFVGALVGQFALFVRADLAHVKATIAANFLVVEADQWHINFLRKFDQHRVFLATGDAP